ncbi:hypothetical protein CBR_g8660 [Chara braunii]|uniref:26S proteasome complex subunit SEM1 n=1 Tax=Chara braunii TaxID=69332 RepID=A0A388JS91_CHABU|nr:hypothetical protein CBR_g8660 [Chara braunii]|eukprot:GBG60640.1 hypothetical protein CBR_g8660 [Chara braunii]
MAAGDATESAQPAAETARVDVFEDDDEFEEFENEDWDEQEGEKEAVAQWEDDWDDDDVNDDFAQQLRAELDRVAES